MKRMKIFSLLAGITAAALLAPRAEAEPKNVILFLVDDLGWMDLGCQGSKYYRTPNIDKLAAEGVRFTNAYAACAVCSPTRAAILTGKVPARLMLTQWLPAGRWSPGEDRMREGRFLRQLPLEERTLPETLREAGYATWHVGKWHLGGAPFSLPEQHGFDANVAGSEHGAPGGYFFPFKGIWKIPTTNQAVVKQTLPDGEEGDYLTDRLTAEAIGLIENREPGKPFFLYFPFYAVHAPLQGKPELMAEFEAIPEADRQGSPAYAAMVKSVDENIGRVMAALEKLELKESTLIVFTSDNGGFANATSNAPLRANKGSHYEGGIRVPLIFAGGGIGRHGETAEPAAISCDLYPTILELLGLPDEPFQCLDGISLAAELKGASSPPPRPLFWHYPHYNQHPQSAPVSVIREGNWKLIESLESGDLELYDLENDLGESRNLAAEKPELAAELRKKLAAWKQEVRAEPMTPNPECASTIVFERSGEFGYRIPSLITAGNGDVLAFCERRVGLADHAKNDIVLRCSQDNGKTWSDLQVIADEGGDSLNDPSAIVVDTGEIILMYQWFPEGYHSITSGHMTMADRGYGGPRNTRTAIRRSQDHGKTWSEAEDVTRAVRRPEAVNIASPGRGIQLRKGPHAGRLLYPVYENHSTAGKQIWNTSALISDDRGKTWRPGEMVPADDLRGFGNENQIVELKDGAILMSSRNQSGEAKRRLTVSRDGGETWAPYRLADDLVTPACMAGLIRHGDLLIHSLPNTTKERKDGAILISRDEGRTWRRVYTIDPGPFAYSSLTELADGTVACLYEAGGYQSIRFVRIPEEVFLAESVSGAGAVSFLASLKDRPGLYDRGAILQSKESQNRIDP